MTTEFSPRAWGWTGAPSIEGLRVYVFPTGVGVDRINWPGSAALFAFSPRAWGWTGDLDLPLEHIGVFPTGVGVDR